MSSSVPLPSPSLSSWFMVFLCVEVPGFALPSPPHRSVHRNPAVQRGSAGRHISSQNSHTPPCKYLHKRTPLRAAVRALVTGWRPEFRQKVSVLRQLHDLCSMLSLSATLAALHHVHSLRLLTGDHKTIINSLWTLTKDSTRLGDVINLTYQVVFGIIWRDCLGKNVV